MDGSTQIKKEADASSQVVRGSTTNVSSLRPEAMTKSPASKGDLILLKHGREMTLAVRNKPNLFEEIDSETSAFLTRWIYNYAPIADVKIASHETKMIYQEYLSNVTLMTAMKASTFARIHGLRQTLYAAHAAMAWIGSYRPTKNPLPEEIQYAYGKDGSLSMRESLVIFASCFLQAEDIRERNYADLLQKLPEFFLDLTAECLRERQQRLTRQSSQVTPASQGRDYQGPQSGQFQDRGERDGFLNKEEASTSGSLERAQKRQRTT